MTAPLTTFERAVLAELAERDEAPPAELAIALNADLETVLDTVATLQTRGYLARQAFDSCRLTERGRAAVREHS